MISVLTPTYNRAYTLTRLYKSLCAQKYLDFEWVIVDDGSNDDTQKLIKQFQIDCTFEIINLKQDNLGKPSAINNGVKSCSGQYIFIVDSDDALTDDSLENIKLSFEAVDITNVIISGVAFRRSHFDNRMIGTTFPVNYPELSYMHSTDAGHVFKGDLAYCFKKDILLKFPFPLFGEEKFVPELYIWNKISDVAFVQYHNFKAIYLCDYLNDGLSANFRTQLKKNPRGFGLFYKDQIRREKNIIHKIKYSVRFLQCLMLEIIK